MNKRTARAHEMNVGFVQSRSFPGHKPRADFDAGLAQMSKAASRNLWVRVFDGRNDAFDSRFDKHFSARRRAAMMCMRFKRDIGRCPLRPIAGLFQRDCLRLLYSIVEIETLTNDFAALVNYDGSDQPAGPYLPHTARG